MSIVPPDDPLAIPATDAVARNRVVRGSIAAKVAQHRENQRRVDNDGKRVAAVAPPPITDRAGTLAHMLAQAEAAGDTEVAEILGQHLADEIARQPTAPVDHGDVDQGARPALPAPPTDLAGRIAAAETAGDWDVARQLKIIQATDIAQRAEGLPPAQGENR